MIASVLSFIFIQFFPRSKLADFGCIKVQSARRVDGTLQTWVLTRQRMIPNVACNRLLLVCAVCGSFFAKCANQLPKSMEQV